ncbi:MAG TPA: hypothetical protein DD670_04145 [Planctomycetaceae bacterium]|nr:hypothetical protein [Planctomycetaceae bacterium]
MEEICLWGYNTLCVHFPAWQFEDFDDPRAKAHLDRLRELLKAARSIGMDAGLLQAWNGGFASAPRSVRGVNFNHRHGGGSFGMNICPSQPEGREYLRKLNSKLLDQFRDVGLNSVWHWPYDEGGCGCEECWPWGWRGYVALSKEVTASARARYPGCVSVLSTWCFDYLPSTWRSSPSCTDEWEGLSKALARDHDWVDFILAESHGDFPRYPLDKGVPGGLPQVNFPEISMNGQFPWGGYGANPLPERLQRLWDQTRGRLAGGVPYSEGIFEDINKIICCRFYWDPDQSAADAVKEYIAFEFSPDVVEDVFAAIQIMEKNHPRQIARCNYSVNAIDDRAGEAARLIEGADAVLTPQARCAWRWRILVLRALIDQELHANNQGRAKADVFRRACEELVQIYHAEKARNAVRPRTIRPFESQEPVISVDYARAVAESKPLAWWTMREFDNRTVKDASGHGNEATCQKGVVLVPSTGSSSETLSEQSGRSSAYFAGGRMTAVVPLGDTYSVEFWFYNALPTDIQPVTGYLFSRGNESITAGCGDHLGISGTYRARGRLSPGRLFFFTGGSRNEILSGKTVLRPETWNHLVLTRDGDRITVYLNGAEEPEISGSIREGSPSDATRIFVGGRTDNFSNFQGLMRDVSVYDRVLTIDEIRGRRKQP